MARSARAKSWPKPGATRGTPIVATLGIRSVAIGEAFGGAACIDRGAGGTADRLGRSGLSVCRPLSWHRVMQSARAKGISSAST